MNKLPTWDNDQFKCKQNIGYLCATELTTRSLFSVSQPLNYNNRRILLLYFRHVDSHVF